MHPRFILSPNIIETIRNNALQAELQGRLTDAQLELIYREKWFHLFVPVPFGGLALPLPEAVRLEESLAYADGSLGWVVTLCAGAGMFIGYFNEDLANEVFTVPDTCIAGSGQANGTAKATDGGFMVTGMWPYASGAPHATHFTGNCIIDGTGEVRSFIFKRDEVTLHPTWKYLGLNATAGSSYSVSNLRIPANRTFIIDAAYARLAHPVYRYPFLQLAEATIAANFAGMCAYFFDLAEAHLINKQSGRLQGLINKGLELHAAAIAETERLRSKFYAALEASWKAHVEDELTSPAQLSAVSQTSKQLASQARNLVNMLYPYCGLDAARTGTIINQVWRNINTASQHTLLLETANSGSL